MPDAEEVQELGRQGVAIIKRWLEATTYIELPWDAYNHAPLCLVPHLAGRKKFDLSGLYLAPKKNPLYVESKRYSSASRQYKEFMHFLAIAYSSALKRRNDYGDDLGAEFFWVTFHPFNLDNWSKLENHTHVRKALEDHPEYLGGTDIDDDLTRLTAERITVLVFNPKQEQLSLTKDELNLVRTVINRKANEL